MKTTAQQQKIAEKDSKNPISNTEKGVAKIVPLQAALIAYDNDANAAAVSDTARTDANEKAAALDKELGGLAQVIGDALAVWLGDADETVTFPSETILGQAPIPFRKWGSRRAASCCSRL